MHHDAPAPTEHALIIGKQMLQKAGLRLAREYLRRGEIPVAASTDAHKTISVGCSSTDWHLFSE